MDVNPQMPIAALPEQNNAQLPSFLPLALIRQDGLPSPAAALNLHPQGVEKCLGVTPCARVCRHDVVAPGIALSRRTRASH